MAEKLIDIGEVCTHDYYNRFRDEAFPAFDTAYKLLPTIDLATTSPKRYIGDAPSIDVSQRYEVVSINDPRLKMSPLGELPIVTTFGDLTTAKRVPFINSQFYLGVEVNETVVTGNPLVSIVGDPTFENMLKIATSEVAGVNVGSVESKDGLRYIPGYEFGLWATSVFTPPTVDGFIKGGIFDGDNGFWIGYKLHEGSIQFGVARVRNGVEYFVPQSEFNMDKMDGTGLSKFNINPSFGNVYLIRGGYLGFAPIVFSVKLPNGPVLPFHIIKYPNTSDHTHISHTNLPVRTEVSNGTANEKVSIKIGSLSAFVTNGANVEANVRKFSLGLTKTLASPYVRKTLSAFENSGVYSGGLLPSPKSHRIVAVLDFFSVTISGQNKPILLEILIVPTTDLISGTFVAVDPDSILKHSEDAVYNLTNAKVIFTTSLQNPTDKAELLATVLRLPLRPGEDAIFAISSTTALGVDAVFSNAWSELW